MNSEKLLNLATELGCTLAVSGGEIYRVEESVYRLLRAYSIWENICMPLALDQADVDAEYLEDLAERCGIPDKLDNYPDQLSGGEQQRVALIRAMAHKPAVVLADEPTGNLDYKTGMSIMSLMEDCRREFGQTIVMVTHDNECASYADRIVRLEDGRFVEE